MHEDDGDTLEICGIDGRATDPVTKGELNLFIRRVKIFHLQPMQKKVVEMHTYLFDPDDGFATILKAAKSMRRWICIGATWAAALVIGGLTLLVKLHELGWFK